MGGLWALVFMACLDGILGVGRQNSGRHLKQGKTSLDDLLNRLDTSIQEHNARLQRGLPTIHYRTDVGPESEEGPTIVQSGWEDGTTQLESPNDDTSDYVNAAPWTRGPVQNSALQAHDLQKIRMASDNARWVKDNAKCEVPLRRCVSVAKQYSDTNRKYWPRCAILHRCGDDAGCCNSLEHTCAMAESENVDLYFYVYEATRAGVQMMTFANHTKCSCQPKSAVGDPDGTNEENVNSCKCPKHFVAVTSRGQCVCDCSEGKSTCRKYRRGKRYLSGNDIRCISTGECSEPACEYGPFVLRKRRCTKRRERERYVTARK